MCLLQGLCSSFGVLQTLDLSCNRREGCSSLLEDLQPYLSQLGRNDPVVGYPSILKDRLLQICRAVDNHPHLCRFGPLRVDFPPPVRIPIRGLILGLPMSPQERSEKLRECTRLLEVDLEFILGQNRLRHFLRGEPAAKRLPMAIETVLMGHQERQEQPPSISAFSLVYWTIQEKVAVK